VTGFFDKNTENKLQPESSFDRNRNNTKTRETIKKLSFLVPQIGLKIMKMY